MTVLSASSVATYADCHLQWYFEYVEMRPSRSEAMDLGQEVHDYAEGVLKNLRGDDVGEYWPAADSEAMRLAEVFSNDILPTYGKPVLVEAGFELSVEGITYTGFIDAVDLHPVKVEEATFSEYWAKEVAGSYPTGYIVRDLKTSKNRPRPGRYRRNLIGYYLGAREMGYKADLLRLDYVVKTKKAYYWPEDQQVPDDDEIDIWAAEVVSTHRSIESGDFEATAIGTYKCGGCPFRDVCGPYERYQELTSPLRKE